MKWKFGDTKGFSQLTQSLSRQIGLQTQIFCFIPKDSFAPLVF